MSRPDVPVAQPDPEVAPKVGRRRFTAAYKRDILKRADRCKGQAGKLGELLRREGLYFSHLTVWRRQMDIGAEAALEPKKRGRPAKVVDPESKQMAELRRENERLKRRLDQATLIIEFQKKVHELLGIPLSSPPDDESGSSTSSSTVKKRTSR